MVWQTFFSVTLAFSIPFSFSFVIRFGETDGMSAFVSLALLTSLWDVWFGYGYLWLVVGWNLRMEARQEENEAWRIKKSRAGNWIGDLIIAFKAGLPAAWLFGLICMASSIRPAYLIYIAKHSSSIPLRVPAAGYVTLRIVVHVCMAMLRLPRVD